MQAARLALRTGAFLLVAVCTDVACTFDLSGYAGDPVSSTNDGALSVADAADADPFDATIPDASYAEVVTADHPVALFHFDDSPDAGAAADSIGGNDALRSSTGVTFGPSDFRGGALTLTGGGNLDMGNVFSFSGLVPFSLEVWMRPDPSMYYGRLMRKRDESDPSNFMGYVLYVDGDHTLHFEGWGADLSAWGPVASPLSTTGFTHVVATVSYEGGVGNAAVYIDGRRTGVGGYNNTTPLPVEMDHVYIGEGFVGTLDELAIYDYALSPLQIDTHFNAGSY